MLTHTYSQAIFTALMSTPLYLTLRDDRRLILKISICRSASKKPRAT